MHPTPRLIEQIRQTIDSGYYQRQAPRRRERRSLTEAIEAAAMVGQLPLLVEIAAHASDGRQILPSRPAAGHLIDRLAAAEPTGLSVWVEPRMHAGDLRWLNTERRQPLLCKDWIIDPTQIVGGDAILLSGPLMQAARVSEQMLIEAAHEQDMEVVLEVFTPEQLAAAKSTEADIVMINNAGAGGNGGAHINTTVELLRMGRTRRPIISYGGIQTQEQVRTLITAGANALELEADQMARPDILTHMQTMRRAILGRDPIQAQAYAPEPGAAGKID